MFFMRILTVALFSLAYLSCQRKPDDISTEVYATDKGYAYRIYLHGKTAIQQETVPGLPGARAFCDSLDAQKVSRLVKSKIEKRQNPAVTAAEIDSLKIGTKC